MLLKIKLMNKMNSMNYPREQGRERKKEARIRGTQESHRISYTSIISTQEGENKGDGAE